MSSNTEAPTEKQMGQLIAEIAKFGGADKISASQLARILLPYIRQHDSTLKAEYEEKVREARLRGAVDCSNFIMRHDESSFRSERAWFKIKPGLLLEYQADLMKEIQDLTQPPKEGIQL